MNQHTIVAVDIAKDSLQVLIGEENINIAFSDKELAALKKKMTGLEKPMVVCEATGGYERKLLEFCHNNAIAVCLVNPARVRAFAHSEGLRAKSDPIDAKMLRRFAQGKELRPTVAPSEECQELADLLDRRAQLTGALASEKNRAQKCAPSMKPSIKRSIRFHEKEISKIDEAIDGLIKNNDRLSKAHKTMQSIKGVGKITSWTIAAFLSEITEVNRNQVVALAGIAPYDKDSGKRKGKRQIQAGRAKVRRALYMAAQTAAQHNPVIRTYVEGLKARGKPYKCAIVAAMRKLLIHIQSELKKHEFCLA
ncbi:MAG: IS110 family transposase [Opitutales bacterium]|nr:IS110 family transposase [Opitutales bacterium]